VIKRFGLLNESVARTSTQFGIPHPGTFVLDADGRVTARYFQDAYQERDTLAGIFVRQGDSGQTATAASTAHVDVRAGISASVVAPGHRISLVLDIRPKRQIHLYAPGNEGYRTVEMKIVPQPHLTVHPLQYPPPQEFFFQPLNERWKVYGQPFRLVQDVTIAATTQAQAALRTVTSLTIAGALEYQACDDKVCFRPLRSRSHGPSRAAARSRAEAAVTPSLLARGASPHVARGFSLAAIVCWLALTDDDAGDPKGRATSESLG
jgi:hypothetical protein